MKVVGTAAGACALSQTSCFSADYTNTKAAEETVAGMPRRVLGRTGARVSLVGFPGLALVQEEYDQA